MRIVIRARQEIHECEGEKWEKTDRARNLGKGTTRLQPGLT